MTALNADTSTGNGYRWYALALLVTIYTIYNVDRNLVPALAEPIKTEFGLSDSQLGLVAGLVYAASYCVAGLPLGLLCDRVNRSRLIAALLAVWSAATVLGGFVTSYTTLILARIGVAAAESGASPTCISLITDFFPKHQRATAIGLFFLSTSFGVALGYAMAGIVAMHWGWRTAFFVGGAPGLLLAVVVLLTLREPKRGAFDPEAQTIEQRSSFRAVTKLVWQQPTLLYLSIGGVAIIAGQSGILTFLAPFLIRVHQLPIDKAGLVIALIIGGGTAIGTTVGGVLADYLSKRSPSAGCQFVACTTFMAMPFAVAGLLAPGIVAAVACLFCYVMLITCFYGATFATYLGQAPATMRGALGAFLVVLFNLVGYGFGPQLSGLFSDLFRSVGIQEPLRWALVVTTLLYPISGIFYLLAGRSVARDSAHESLD